MKEKIRIGNVLTEEIMSHIGGEDLTFEQKGKLISCVLYPDKFKPDDILMKVLHSSVYPGYVSISLSCAKSKLKELERLDKFYAKKSEYPKWFPEYFRTNTEYLNNVIKTLSNIIGVTTNVSEASTNVSETLANISGASDNVSKTLDNVPLTFAIDNNNNNNNNYNPNNNKGIVDIQPPKSPTGGLDGESSSDSVSEPDSILDDPAVALGLEKADAEESAVDDLAREIESTYRYKVNGGKLRKCLTSILKKNGAAEIRTGYQKWLEMWRVDDFQWAPGRITDWLYDQKFLEPPRRKKTAPAETSQVSSSCLA